MPLEQLKDKPVGSIVQLRENNLPVEFYVAQHDYEARLNGTGRTLLVRKDCYDTRNWHDTAINAYATSAIDAWLNSTYKSLLDPDIHAVMGTTQFYYTRGNGSKTVTTLNRSVFLLSAAEVGWSEYGGKVNAEGTKLSGAETIRSSNTAWWTRSPDLDGTTSAIDIRAGGGPNYNGVEGARGSRPAFTLPASLYITDDGFLSRKSTQPKSLGSKVIGGIVRLKIDGILQDFIVVHHGQPSDWYHDSCNGTWLLLKDCLEKMAWHSSTPNSYKNSTIHNYLNSTWLNKLDADIQNSVKQVKIPYVNGMGLSGTVASDANGLSCKVFLLAGCEVGFTKDVNSYLPIDGAKLDYFNSGDDSVARSKRISYLGGSVSEWWLRSPSTKFDYGGWSVEYDGSLHGNACTYPYGIRPAFILPSYLFYTDDGSLVPNAPPSISGNIPNNTNLGTKNEGFEFTYTVEDADGDQVTVREYLDNTLKRTYAATAGESNTFQAVADANWQRVLNGEHTLKVVANDGKEDSEAYAVTFTKAVYSAGVTLETPMEADDQIRVMVMALVGSVPADAELEVLVTNNAKDDEPVWEDATGDVKTGTNHVFANQTAANGFAFNFKLTVSRGENGQGGYLTSIGGAFE